MNKNNETKMTCICCPIGCQLTVTKTADGYEVTDNKCPRGKKYGIEEMTAPKRMVTSTVKINGGLYSAIPVKTDQPAPKEKMFDIINILANVTVQAPIKMGDVIVENIADTGVNIIASKTDDGKH